MVTETTFIIVIFWIGVGKPSFSSSAESPEDSQEQQEEDDTRCNGNRDENDNSGREELCRGGKATSLATGIKTR